MAFDPEGYVQRNPVICRDLVRVFDIDQEFVAAWNVLRGIFIPCNCILVEDQEVISFPGLTLQADVFVPERSSSFFYV